MKIKIRIGSRFREQKIAVTQKIIEPDLPTVKKYLPEYREILKRSGGHKPRKFVEAIRIIATPASFNPSGIGDYAYLNSYGYETKTGKIGTGPGYSYESMLPSGVTPRERMVEVPKGMRMWITIYDGMWGGYWSTVNVYVHPDEMPPEKERLVAVYELTNEEWAVLALTAQLISSARAPECYRYNIDYYKSRDSLIQKGLLNKNGAINSRGKAAFESKFGFKDYYQILRELGFQE